MHPLTQTAPQPHRPLPLLPRLPFPILRVCGLISPPISSPRPIRPMHSNPSTHAISFGTLLCDNQIPESSCSSCRGEATRTSVRFQQRRCHPHIIASVQTVFVSLVYRGLARCCLLAFLVSYALVGALDYRGLARCCLLAFFSFLRTRWSHAGLPYLQSNVRWQRQVSRLQLYKV